MSKQKVAEERRIIEMEETVKRTRENALNANHSKHSISNLSIAMSDLLI